MAHYQPRTEDQLFILNEVLRAQEQLRPLAAFRDADADLQAQVLKEAARFVAEVIAPLNDAGDRVGCTFSEGVVATPPGFRQAYRAFREAGWPALACAPEDGGQGLPCLLESVLYEWLSAANHGWTMAPALLHGAYECLKHHGSDELKESYLPRIASGEWLPTMCLTEPQAGSDLGLVRTRATPRPDGSWLLSGSKIFISGGDHDLTDNIVHLVLARVPDAPAGPKGLSLFLAPKWLDGGVRNGAYCDRIEEKMGLHGSPTCAMRFENATGWLIGEPGRGLAAMFVMMNAARLHVALQGLGLLDAAWQKADAYARERRQMRLPGPRETQAAADAIEGHPAMRRILDTQRAWIDGGRVLAYQTALELDIARQHPDADRRASASSWCALVTPVLKAAFTRQAFLGASECLQVFGGHGYIRESGIEQHVRDARVTMIYEGTNEIQAIDLLVRKVLPDGGRALRAMLDRLLGTGDADSPEGRDAASAIEALWQATQALCTAAPSQPRLPYEAADDYLRAAALALMAWAWARIAEAGTQPRWRDPLAAARLRLLPELRMRCAIIEQQCTAAAGAQAFGA